MKPCEDVVITVLPSGVLFQYLEVMTTNQGLQKRIQDLEQELTEMVILALFLNTSLTFVEWINLSFFWCATCLLYCIILPVFQEDENRMLRKHLTELGVDTGSLTRVSLYFISCGFEVTTKLCIKSFFYYPLVHFNCISRTCDERGTLNE